MEPIRRGCPTNVGSNRARRRNAVYTFGRFAYWQDGTRVFDARRPKTYSKSSGIRDGSNAAGGTSY